MNNSTVNGPGTLTNAPGKTVALAGDTIATPLINQGTLTVLEFELSPAAPFINAAGGVVEIQANSQFGSVTLTASAGLTNAGTVDLTDTFSSSNFGSTLTVTGAARWSTNRAPRSAPR